MMPDPKNEPTQVIPAVKGNLTRSDDPAIYQAMRQASAPRKKPADLGLDRVSFTYLDDSGNLKTVSPLIWHDALNDILEFLEASEVG